MSLPVNNPTHPKYQSNIIITDSDSPSTTCTANQTYNKSEVSINPTYRMPNLSRPMSPSVNNPTHMKSLPTRIITDPLSISATCTSKPPLSFSESSINPKSHKPQIPILTETPTHPKSISIKILTAPKPSSTTCATNHNYNRPEVPSTTCTTNHPHVSPIRSPPQLHVSPTTIITDPTSPSTTCIANRNDHRSEVSINYMCLKPRPSHNRIIPQLHLPRTTIITDPKSPSTARITNRYYHIS